MNGGIPHRCFELRGPGVLSTGCTALALLGLGIILGCSEVDRTRMRARLGDTEAQLELSQRYATGDGTARRPRRGTRRPSTSWRFGMMPASAFPRITPKR